MLIGCKNRKPNARTNENSPWYLKSLRKSKLIYGGRKDFQRPKKRSLTRVKWTRDIVGYIIERHYVLALLEYYHKLLNTQNDTNELPFYYFAGQFAYHFMWFLASINRLGLDSERTMHRQIMDAKTKPLGFRENYLILSGFGNRKASKKSVIRSAHKLMLWSHSYIVNKFGTEDFSKGFREVLLKIKI